MCFIFNSCNKLTDMVLKNIHRHSQNNVTWNSSITFNSKLKSIGFAPFICIEMPLSIQRVKSNSFCINFRSRKRISFSFSILSCDKVVEFSFYFFSLALLVNTETQVDKIVNFRFLFSCSHGNIKFHLLHSTTFSGLSLLIRIKSSMLGLEGRDFLKSSDIIVGGRNIFYFNMFCCDIIVLLVLFCFLITNRYLSGLKSLNFV